MATIADLAYGVNVQDRATGPLRDIARAADAAGVAVEQMDQRVGRTNATFAQTAARLDPVERAVAGIERQTRTLTAAMEAAERQARAEGVAQERLAAVIQSGARMKEDAALRAVRGLSAEQQALALTRAGYQQLAAQIQATANAQVAATRAVGTLSVANDNAALRTRALAEANEQAGRSSGQLRGAMQQVGFQVQDVATQIAMGQNALLAFGVQGAQLLGIFGAGGALAGVALLFGTIAANILMASRSTETLNDTIRDQEEAYQRVTSAAERWREGLVAEGERVQELRAFYASLDKTRLAYEVRTLEATQRGLMEEAGGLASRAAEPLAGLRNRIRLAEGLSGARGDTLPAQLSQARDLLRAFDELSRVDPARAILALNEGLSRLAAEAGRGGQGLRDAIDQVDRAVPQADRLARSLQQNNQALAVAREAYTAAGNAVAELGAAAAAAEGAVRAISRIRFDGIDDLTTQAQNAAAVLRALNAGGPDAAARVEREQRALELTARAREADIRGIMELNRVSRDEAARRADDAVVAQARWEAANRLVETNFRLEGARQRSGRVSEDVNLDLAAAQQAVNDANRDWQSLQGEGAQIFAQTRTEAERYAETQGRLNALLASGAIDQETYNRAVEQADPSVRAARQVAERQAQEINRTTDRITDFFGQSFARAFENTGGGFRSLMESFRRAAISTFASIAAQAIIRPIIAPIVGSVAGSGMGQLIGIGSSAANAATAGGGEGGGLLSQASSALGLARFIPGSDGIGGMFGGVGRGVTGFLNQPLYNAPFGAGSMTASGFNAGTALPGEAGFFAGGGGVPTVSVGSAIGGAANIAGGAYGIYSGIQRGGVGGAVQGVGGALSTVSGALALAGMGNPFLMAAAAVLQVIGALLPGQRPSARTQTATANLADESLTFGGFTGSRFSAENRDAAASIARSILDQNSNLAERLGFRAQGTVAVGVSNSQSRRGGEGQFNLYFSDAAGGFTSDRFDRDEQGARELAERAAQRLFDSFRIAAQNLDTDLARITRNSASMQALDANLNWFETVYKSLTEGRDRVGAFEQAMQQLVAPFDAAIAKARELGLAEAGLVRVREERVAELQAQRWRDWQGMVLGLDLRAARAANDNGRVLDLERGLLGIGQQNEAVQFREQLRNMSLSAEQVTDAMQRLGVAQQAEAAARERELAAQAEARRQAAAQEAAGAITSLTSFARGLMRSEFSPLNSVAQYSQAAATFGDVAARAGQGDPAAIRELQGASQNFLASSRTVFGSGVQSVRDFEAVTAAISGVAALSEDMLTGAFFAETMRTQMDRLVDEVRSLRTELAQIRLAPARLAA